MAEKGYGAKFFYNTTTELANVMAITPPSIDVEDIDTSVMLSTGQWRTFVSGWKDGGEVGVTLQYAKAITNTLEGLIGTDDTFVVEFSDGGKWTVAGYIKGLGDEIDIDGIVTTVITIKISGVPAFTV